MATQGHQELGAPVEPGNCLRARFPSSLETARLARVACRPLLAPVGDRSGDIELVVTELVTNGVRHARVDGENSVTLEVAVTDTHVRVEVIDEGVGFAPPPPADPASPSPGGWGLVMVDELCDEWGVFMDGGTHVWGHIPYN